MEITQKSQSDKGNPLKNFFDICLHGIQNFKATQPREFLQTIGLDYNSIQVGLISGQAHHRKSDSFREPLVKLGVLTPSDAAVKSPELKAYTAFGNYSITFPLKDEVGNIVSLFAWRFKIQTPKGEYLNNEGVYPAFPEERTTRLFLTQTVIDAASLIQSGFMENRDAVIALHNGSTTYDIRRAITRLTDLKQIILFAQVNNPELEKELTSIAGITCQTLIVPENSLNEMWVKYGIEGLREFINEIHTPSQSIPKCAFTEVSSTQFIFLGQELTYHISGTIPSNPSLLEMNFELQSAQMRESYQIKIDLLNLMQTKSWLYEWTEGKEVNYTIVLSELEQIRDELQKIRITRKKEVLPVRGFSPAQDRKAKQILQSPGLFRELDDLISRAGVIGEETNRLLLFIIASSYRTSNNLHAVIQSSDMVAGAELVNRIADMIPELDRYALDVTTSRTFRYYGNKTIDRKLLVIPDYSGIIASKAITDLKRLQARNQFSNDAPKKNADGELVTEHKIVEGHTSSIGASSSARKAFSMEPKTVVLDLDTSTEQMQSLIEYDCKRMAGLIDDDEQKRAIELLQYVLKNVHPLDVINPHASSLMIPAHIPNARNLTVQLLHFTSLVTLFYQHQRSKDEKGRVIIEKQDVQTATDIFLGAVVVNTDELDASTLELFGRLKQEFPNGKQFTSMDVQQLGISKTQANRQLLMLVQADYLKKEGHKNTGFSYTVIQTEEVQSVKNYIQQQLANFSEQNESGH